MTCYEFCGGICERFADEFLFQQYVAPGRGAKVTGIVGEHIVSYRIVSYHIISYRILLYSFDKL